jgi:glycyl-tRNA synthetase
VSAVVPIPFLTINVFFFQVDEIASELMQSDLATRVDKSSATLGRRYARSDEVGVPFAVTVDFDTLTDDTVTIRERDSMIQVRAPKKDVANVIFDIVHQRMTWEQVTKKYPVVQVDEGEGKAAGKAAEPGAKTVVEANSRGRFSRPAPKN